MTWTIYRDGYAYTVLTHSFTSALVSAELVPRQGNWARPDSEKTYGLHEGVTRCEAEALAVEGLPTFVRVRDYGHELELVWLLEAGRMQVRTVETKSFAFADRLRVLVSLLRKSKQARARKLEYVAARRYKSGPREGELRFLKRHDEDFRARVLAAVAHNEQRAVDIDDYAGAVNWARASLDFDVDPVARDLAAVDVELELVAELIALEATIARRDTLSERGAALERMRASLACVAEHGADLGARVYVLRNPDAPAGEDTPEGWGEVVRVEAGYRDVEVGGKEWIVPVSACARYAPEP